MVGYFGLSVVADKDVYGPYIAQLQVILMKKGSSFKQNEQYVPNLLILEGLQIFVNPIIDLIL